jgi:hypothetical protein
MASTTSSFSRKSFFVAKRPSSHNPNTLIDQGGRTRHFYSKVASSWTMIRTLCQEVQHVRYSLRHIPYCFAEVPVYTASSWPILYALEVWWRADDDRMCFTLRCQSKVHMERWEAQINRLIKEAADRRAAVPRFHNVVSQISNSTSPASGRSINALHHDGSTSPCCYSLYPGPLPDVMNIRARQSIPYSVEEQFEPSLYPSGLESHSPPGSGTPSGRGTPLASRETTQ